MYSLLFVTFIKSRCKLFYFLDIFHGAMSKNTLGIIKHQVRLLRLV